MQKAMAEIQKKMAGMNGVPVLQVMKMSMPGNSAQAAQMAQARARLEAMKPRAASRPRRPSGPWRPWAAARGAT